jgi:HAMP domain-containing protein
MATESGEELRFELEELAKVAAQMIGPAFTAAGALYAVLGFTPGPGGWATSYCSSAERGDMIRALREMADRLEQDPAASPRPAMPKDDQGRPIMQPNQPGDLQMILDLARDRVGSLSRSTQERDEVLAELRALARTTRHALFLWLEGEIRP